MAITTAMCTSFKKEVLEALHDFNVSSGSTFKIALYTSAADLGAATTVYSSSNEVTGTGYTAGGITLTNIDPVTSGTTAFADFADATWTSATITAAGALIYNSSQSNKAVAVLSFGGDKTSTNGDFVIQFPVADASNAIIRIA
jgi:VCBS repeat-containing protein